MLLFSELVFLGKWLCMYDDNNNNYDKKVQYLEDIVNEKFNTNITTDKLINWCANAITHKVKQ